MSRIKLQFQAKARMTSKNRSMNRSIHGVQQLKFGSDSNPEVVRIGQFKGEGFVYTFLPMTYCESCWVELRDKFAAIKEAKLKPRYRAAPIYDGLMRGKIPVVFLTSCGKKNLAADVGFDPVKGSIMVRFCPIHSLPYAVNFSNVSTGAVTMCRRVSTNKSECFRRLKRKTISSR